ncbi:MAG: hypothetical protein AB7E04_08775 [Desulfobacteraceae bacterium]
MKKNWTIFNGLLAVVVSLMLMTGCSDDNSTSSVASGKVVQSPVAGATVFLDINGNRLLDENEPSATSGNDGSYSLGIPDGKEGMLCTTGGTLIDSGRPALPTLAPRDAKNITPLTTLVAINPDIRATLGSDWDVDISRASGVPGSILRLALAIESFQSSLKSLNSDAPTQFKALTLLAGNLSGKVIKSEADVKKAFSETLVNLAAAGSELPPTILENVNEIVDSINADDTVVESTAKAAVKDLIPSSPAIAFLPSTDMTKMVMPMPNDIVWTGLEGKLPTAGETDASKLALYTAINKLGNSGLSPNTPISIPLSDDTALDMDSVEDSVLLLQLPTFTPVTDFSVVQDGRYIKIYPEDPLEAGTQYAVVLKNTVYIEGSTEEKVSKNPLFELLKSTEALYADEATASDTTKTLEQIRQGYVPLFTALGGLGITRTGVLTLFTFTTASETLSAADFAVMQATIAAGGDPDGMNITGLDYASVTGEYALINGSVSLARVPTMTVDADSFTSWKVSTLATTPIDEEVPYTIYNGSSYVDTVVVFQHGFGGSKDNAYAYSGKFPDYPVAAMDLPYHGDRTSQGETSGSEYLTTNLPQNRINLYQSFYDMSVFIQGLKQGKFDIDGDGAPDAPPTNIYFVGQSLGSITGSVAANNNTASLDKVVLNVGGANFASILDTATNAALTGLLDKLGVEKNSVQYFVTLGVLQLIMDPCDPMYLAADLAINPDIETIFQFAYKDTLVSNVSNEILATVAESDDVVEVKEFSTNVTFENGKPYLFGNADDKNDSWIPHGFLLDPRVEVNGELKYPEAEGFMDADYASEANAAVVDWTEAYLN